MLDLYFLTASFTFQVELLKGSSPKTPKKTLKRAARTSAVVAAELQQAVEHKASAHGVADQRDRPVAVRALHQHVRQQPPRLREWLERRSSNRQS